MKRDEILIEPQELRAKLADPGLRIFDATIAFHLGVSPEEAAALPSAHDLYLAEHLPGAAFFDHQLVSDPLGAYEFTVAPDQMLAQQIGGFGIDNDVEVIVYASSLLASAMRAWWILRYAGARHVRVLNGGLVAWKEAGGEVVAGEHTYEPRTFVPTFSRDMIATKDEVHAAVESGDACIEYALPPEVYGGECIPGSVCLPLTDLTVGWDLLRPTAELVERMPAREDGQRVITYCGGGIAAALNAAAHLIVGDERVAVYDGSLMEWMGEGLPVVSAVGG